MLDLGNLWKATDCTGSLTSDDLLKFVNELKHEYAEPGKVVLTSQELQTAYGLRTIEDSPLVIGVDEWLFTQKTYDTIRWLHHLSKYPRPSRKLRKCHLRKRIKRLQRERKRYFDSV